MWVEAYLLSGSGAVVDQHQCGEDVGGQADDGDEVGGHPGGHAGDQPLPVALQVGLQQGAASAAVLVLLQPLQLVPRQGRGRQLDQLAQDTGPAPVAGLRPGGGAAGGGVCRWLRPSASP